MAEQAEMMHWKYGLPDLAVGVDGCTIRITRTVAILHLRKSRILENK